MASSIVKSAAQQLGNLLVEEAKYLYQVSDKIGKLQKEMAWMECFLRDADTQQHHEKVICIWVSEVRDLAYEAEDIIERYLHEVSHHRRDGIRKTLKWMSCILWTCDAWTLHNLGLEIDNITITISDLTSRLRRYGIQIIKPSGSLEYKNMIREEMRTYSHTIEDVVGLKNEIQKIVDQLVKPDVKVVGISGMAGLGKTTRARKVFQNNVVGGSFNKCVWVYISKEFQRNYVFQEILNGLKKSVSPSSGKSRNQRRTKVPPPHDPGPSLSPSAGELPGEINKVLQDEKCFVVLDDMWEEKDWDSLKPAFESIFRDSSSKLLITTRNQTLLAHIHPFGYLHNLTLLSREDSWELLQRKAFRGHESTDDVQKHEKEQMGREMLTHCNGHPLAIVALGGILSTKRTISEWKDVQNNIRAYLMSVDKGHGHGRPSEVLELSYIDLPFYLKPCFLYLANFPKDYKISTQRLYQLWDAEGLLIADGETGKQGGTSYDVGERYLNALAQRSMVQVDKYWPSGRIKYCYVHEVMRDMCIKKSEEVDFLSVVECTYPDLNSMLSMVASRCSENKKIRRLVVHEKEDSEAGIPSGMHGDKATSLRSILVFSRKEERRVSKRIPQDTWKFFPMLRVLDIEETNIVGFWKGVKDLIHLRYLRLGSIYEVIPSSCFDLKCLETVDLRHMRPVKELPCKFHMLERLKHLYLCSFSFEVEDQKKLRFPVNRMETLVNFDPRRCEIEDLQKMTRLKVFSIIPWFEFKESEDVHLLKGVLEAPVMKTPGQLIYSIWLALSETLIYNEPTILSSLAGHPSCFKLTISGRTSESNRTFENDRGHHTIGLAHSLVSVRLDDCEVRTDLFLALEKLPNLKNLHIQYKHIPSNQKVCFSPGSFPQLNSLSLDFVEDQYKEWELEVGHNALPKLQHFELIKCDRLKKLPEGLPNSIQTECCIP